MAFDRDPRLAAPLAASVLLVTALTAFSSSADADPAAARAEPAPEQRELARELMARGNELRAAQDFGGALEAFRAADEIMHVPTTGFAVARAEVQLGQLVEARDTLLRVERVPAQPDEPQAFEQAREYARLLEAEIGPRIPKLRVRIAAAPEAASGVAVTVDGQSVPVAALDIAFAVDPGSHAALATAADGRTVRQEVTVGEGEEREVVLALPTESPAPPPPPPPREAPRARTRPATSGLPPLAWIAFGTAAGAALIGGATGIVSWRRETSASSRCNGDRCPPSTYGDIDAARTFGTASTVSFAIAGVAAVVGAVSVFAGPGGTVKTRAPDARGVAPWVGLGGMGIVGTF